MTISDSPDSDGVDEHDDQRTRLENPYRREYTFGTILPLATLVITIAIWGHGIFVGLVDRFMAMDSLIAKNTEFRLEYYRSSPARHAHILDNTNDIRALERDLAKLQSVPQARADPFTGTEGKQIERRLDDLERRLEQP